MKWLLAMFLILSGCTMYNDYKSLTPEKRMEIRAKFLGIVKTNSIAIAKIYLDKQLVSKEITQEEYNYFLGLGEIIK